MFATPFWSQIASTVAQNWGERLFGQAFPFWMGGLLAYATAFGWAPAINIVERLEVHLQILLAVGALLVIATSAALVEGMQIIGLRLLEGYWPGFLNPIRRRMIKRMRRHWIKKNQSWNTLTTLATLTTAQRETLIRLEAELATYPPRTQRLLPTRLGNILRATEDYARNRYGLSMGVIWSRLWMVMPEEAHKEISLARDRLDATVRLILWCVLFLVWSWWAWWWTIPISILGIIWGYHKAIEAAGIYGELVRAGFDVYRTVLYETLRWPLPSTPGDELQTGEALTLYLKRGSHATTSLFTSKKP